MAKAKSDIVERPNEEESTSGKDARYMRSAVQTSVFQGKHAKKIQCKSLLFPEGNTLLCITQSTANSEAY